MIPAHEIRQPQTKLFPVVHDSFVPSASPLVRDIRFHNDGRIVVHTHRKPYAPSGIHCQETIDLQQKCAVALHTKQIFHTGHFPDCSLVRRLTGNKRLHGTAAAPSQTGYDPPSSIRCICCAQIPVSRYGYTAVRLHEAVLPAGNFHLIFSRAHSDPYLLAKGSPDQ